MQGLWRHLSAFCLLGLAMLAAGLLHWQWEDIDWQSPSLERWWYAATALAGWLIISGWQLLGWWRQPGKAHSLVSEANWLVAYASQTGFAAQLATQAAEQLQAGGQRVNLLSLRQLSLAALRRYEQALFVVSTTGEGDAPDDASHWPVGEPDSGAGLTTLNYGLLALGDGNYAQFCGFGRRLDDWLQDSGAQPVFARIEVDNGDVTALGQWQQQLVRIAGVAAPQPPADASQTYREWYLQQRQGFAEEAEAGRCFALTLMPESRQALEWQAGDIARIALPSTAEGQTTVNYREYSIASLPEEGGLRLLLRQRHFADGRLGAGSDFLTRQLAVGEKVKVMVRRNPRFHLPEQHCPLILIGNGTGIAGLRALLKERVGRHQRDNWLIFGMRYRLEAGYYRDDLTTWQSQGFLPQLDYVYSRENSTREYVQDRLHRVAAPLADWVQRGAAIYVCGSRQGMASDVDSALADILGQAKLETLRQTGRYCRDVY